ncbi:MAG: hypothetical protein KDM63_19890, partial [Verrucomicrobiae bacterium]|nr:hypothetical protein [Verrucomicrobiae bacterium]
MASASEKAGLGPKGLVLALIGLAVVVAALLWWKSQARDRARAQLVSAFGATIEPSREGEGWDVVLNHESLRDFSDVADLLVTAGPVKALDLSGAPNLASLQGASRLTSLVSLIVIGCPSLGSLDGVTDLPDLIEVVVQENGALTSLDGLRDLPALVNLDAGNCAALKSVSLTGVPHVENLYLFICESMKSLDVSALKG